MLTLDTKQKMRTQFNSCVKRKQEIEKNQADAPMSKRAFERTDNSCITPPAKRQDNGDADGPSGSPGIIVYAHVPYTYVTCQNATPHFSLHKTLPINTRIMCLHVTHIRNTSDLQTCEIRIKPRYVANAFNTVKTTR